MGRGIFRFGRFRLVARERVLTKDGVPVSLGSRAFDLLRVLIERAGDTVDREELFALVWPDVVVSKVNLRVHVAAVRKALEDGRDGNRFIVNVSGRGYRFVAPVARLHESVAASALCVVDLSGIDECAGVAIAVAAALGCEVQRRRPLACVLARLRDKSMLLVFENCAHVFAGVAQLTRQLLTAAPQVQVLVANTPGLRSPPPEDARRNVSQRSLTRIHRRLQLGDGRFSPS